MEIKDKVAWKSHWRIEKYASDSDYLQGILSEPPIELDGNVGLNEGIQAALDLMCDIGSLTPFSNASAYLGVGDSATEASATQTDLQATSNKVYKGMEASYPQRTNQTMAWRSVFGSADANFAWNEFSVANGASGGAVNLNRYVPGTSPGTKGSGSIWTLTLSITMS